MCICMRSPVKQRVVSGVRPADGVRWRSEEQEEEERLGGLCVCAKRKVEAWWQQEGSFGRRGHVPTHVLPTWFFGASTSTSTCWLAQTGWLAGPPRPAGRVACLLRVCWWRSVLLGTDYCEPAPVLCRPRGHFPMEMGQDRGLGLSIVHGGCWGLH